MKRVLVANRGEIAVRIVRACTDEGLESVVVVSAADRDSLAARLADRAVVIGPASATESYLDVDRVMAAATTTGCDAIHPGYGFLSERAELAEECEKAGITFVGPTAEILRSGGDKVAARSAAQRLGIPVGSGSDTVETAAAASAAAETVGYPVILKAVAGGGGKGMVVVDGPEALEDIFTATSFGAQQAFGDGRVYVEHYIANARHVEIQVLGDTHGRVVHLGERDCSLQRRFQKLLEESPAPGVTPETLAGLQDAALTLARDLAYVGAGTVEFIVDLDTGRFGFLEMNTRVQVEHPVTEMRTGIDIVRAQLRVAAGEPLGFTQDDVRPTGHVIECRINAEDPRHGFMPSPGTVTGWTVPQGTDVRVDTHISAGAVVPPYYDSLLAKLIVKGSDRTDAVRRMQHALARFRVEGVKTTVELHQGLLAHEDVLARRHNTAWVEKVFLPGWA